MSDWRDIGDDPDAEEVPSSRFERVWKLGATGARVGASSLAGKLRSYLPFGTEEIREQRLEELFRANAERLVEVLGRLKGASLKVGQLLSMDPELLPDEFSDVLASLQKDVSPMTYDTVVDQIESSLGRDIDTVFEYFDPDPIGAASIGQVHRARLDDDGSEVAVKVQYPGVVDALESDLETLRKMLVYGRIVVDSERLDAYFDEIRRAILEEADYENEAANMARLADLLEERRGLRGIRPVERWTATTVLTMEYAPGEKIDEALKKRSEATRRKLVDRWIRMYAWLLHEKFVLHADPHPGNFLVDDDDRIWVLDYGCIKEYEPAFADGLLGMLVACWEEDLPAFIEYSRELGFSTEEETLDELDPQLFREYLEIILEPFLVDGPFDFSEWRPTMRAKKFMLRNPSFLKLIPPEDALLYYRTLVGIKGLLTKLEMTYDVASVARETARRRNLLDGD